MRVIILGHGKWEHPGVLKELLKKTDLVVACDGAYNKARKHGIKVDVVIGDLDSVSPEKIKPQVKVLVFPADKDKTDGELALRYALSKAPQKIIWYSPFGSRWDHGLANLFSLTQAVEAGVPIELLQGKWSLLPVRKSSVIRGESGERVSLIPFSEEVHGVVASGLKYPLNNEPLFRCVTRGISNVLVSATARIQVKSGLLLVLHERKRRKRSKRI